MGIRDTSYCNPIVAGIGAGMGWVKGRFGQILPTIGGGYEDFM